MFGLSLSHYILHLTYTATLDVLWKDYLYHTIAYIWQLLPRLTPYFWINFTILWLTSDIYYHVWPHMPRVSLSQYRLHRKYPTTFEDKYLDMLYHTIAYTWYLLPCLTTYVWIILITLWLTLDIYYHVWRHMSRLSLSQYGLHLTFTSTFDEICLDYIDHTITYIENIPHPLTTYIYILFITL